MALLTKKAIENPSFRQICSSKSITVSFVSPKKQVTLYNHNKLLGTLDGVFGVKTGFTKKSGRCLVSACCRDGITLVCVTLNAKDDWKDHAKLYEYCFKRCQKADDDFTEVGVFVTGGDRKTVNVETETVPVITDYEGRVERLVTVDRFLYAPVKTGQRVGRAYYYSSDGVLLLETDLISSEAVNAVRIKKQEKKKSIIDFIRDLFRR
jgi:D-alanyl-D-alanine carboxypeptidase/D-alanyl-D-alanine carboxypeptidase (penicillin-binding protein 5/6)